MGSIPTSPTRMNNDREQLFGEVQQLLRRHGHGLNARTIVLDSKAKTQKRAYHLYGKKSISLHGRKPQPTYIAGIILQKHFVGFYHMPMYSHPAQFPIHSPLLQKARKGKSCLNLVRLDAEARAELEQFIKNGVALYKKEGWI